MTLSLSADEAVIRCDAAECSAVLATERERGHEDPDDNDDDASLTERAGWLLRSRRWLAVGAQHFCPGHLPPPARVYTRDEVQAILLALWETRYADTEYLIPPPTAVTVEPWASGLLCARWRHAHHGWGPDEAHALADLVRAARADATRAADGFAREAQELREAARGAAKLDARAQRIRDAVTATGGAR